MADTRLKLPEKRTMNLYQDAKSLEKKEFSIKTVAKILVIVLLVLAVVGRYGMLFYKKAHLAESKEKLAALEAQLTDYDKVKEEFDRYERTFMTAEEKTLLTRQSFINVANSAVGGIGSIEYIAVADNTASIRVVVDSLDDVASIRRNFEKNESVTDVSVYNADNSSYYSTLAESDRTGLVVATINFTLGR